MPTNSNKKTYCKCNKCKQVAEVDVLTHLYDSLNYQIETIQKDLDDYVNIGVAPDLREEAEAIINANYIKTEKRLEKLVSMRDNVEELLDKILKAEVNN